LWSDHSPHFTIPEAGSSWHPPFRLRAETIDEYLARADWRVNANANQGYSLGGMILNASGKLIANYWLDEVYPPRPTPTARATSTSTTSTFWPATAPAGRCGWCSNRASTACRAACRAHLRALLERARPARQLPRHAAERVGGRAGVQLVRHLPRPYVRIDDLSYDEVRQAMQEFIFNLNVPSRWGTQTPFTNLTFDWVCPDDLRDQRPLSAERCRLRLRRPRRRDGVINRAFIDVMTEGDAQGRAFTFPIPTYNITKDFDWEGENVDALFEMTAKYGLPYFQNFVNSDLDPHMIRSMCCRLQLDLTELLKRGNGLFGSAEQTGSIGVVTINCARLGFVHSGDEDGALARLDDLLDIARDSLEAKRAVITRHLEADCSPTRSATSAPSTTTSRRSASTASTSTCGTSPAMTTTSPTRRFGSCAPPPRPRARASRDSRRDRAHVQPRGHARRGHDVPVREGGHRPLRRRGIRHAGTADNPYYTNSSQLPVGFTADPFLAMALQEPLQQKYTGGTVLHLYLGEAMESARACRDLVRRSLERFRLPYLTITPTFSICPRHGYVSGHHEVCPTCDAECEVWTRVMGYFRPISGSTSARRAKLRRGRTSSHPRSLGGEAMVRTLQPVN
jgi:ribonucleoside-triphosphate reductase